MANSEKVPAPENSEIQGDSLNSEICEPTNLIIDNTVRPMRESLRKRLKPAGTNGQQQPPQTPPQGHS